MSALFHFEVEGASVFWRVAHVRGRERLHAPYSFHVVADAVAGDTHVLDLAIKDLITKPARLSWAVEGGGDRVFEGIVDAVELVETHYELTLLPKMALLADAIDYRVFVDQDGLAIAKEILGEHGISIEPRVTRPLPKRAQCVQPFESDLAFVSRILAEEGITWFHAHDKPDALIVTDRPQGFIPLHGRLPVVETGGLNAQRSMHRARIVHRVVTDSVQLRDYDFLAPQLELKADAASAKSDLERYEYPGAFRDPNLGRALATIRLEEARAVERTLFADTNARGLAAGHVVTLDGEPSGDWLVVEVSHEGHDHAAVADERHYSARIVAIPMATPYRPARLGAPAMPGLQTATATGPQGQEIHTEEHARVKALFRWDRLHKKDDRSSAWIRTLQAPTSGGFLLPRVGWEVLVGFSGCSADSPLIVGRLMNGEAGPPNALPAHKIVSAFGTQTTPGGGSANLLQMSDAKGSEAMSFVASKDFNERTENDKVTSITANDTATVGANRKLIVGQVHQLSVAGAQTHAVGGSRSVKVNANKSITAGSESVSIGGLRSFKVGGDSTTGCSSLTRIVGAAKIESAIEHQARAVSGTSTILVGGGWNAAAAAHASVSVGGVSTELIGGPKKIIAGKYALAVKGALNQSFGSRSVTAGASHEEGFNGAASYTISGGATLKGADVIIAAESKLTIKASGITIEMTPGAVKIAGKFDGSIAGVDEGDETYA